MEGFKIITKQEDIPHLNFDSLINYFKNASVKEIEAALKNEAIKEKIFGLNYSDPEIYSDIYLAMHRYEFRKILKVIDMEILIKSIDYSLYQKIKEKYASQASFFITCFLDYNFPKFTNLIWQNTSLLIWFIESLPQINLTQGFNYDFIRQLLNFMLSHNLPLTEAFIEALITIQGQTYLTIAEQTQILNSSFPWELKKLFWAYFDSTLVADYIQKNNFILNSDEVFFCLEQKIKIFPQYYANPDFFMKKIFNRSIAQMHKNLNILRKGNDLSYLDNLLSQMEKEIISLYDEETGNFKKSPHSLTTNFLTQNYNEANSKESSKRILINIISDLLFQDTFVNVCLNIREILRFQASSPIAYVDLELYQKMLTIPELNNNQIIAFYHNYKDKNVKEKFYDDLRLLKNIAYQELKDACFTLKQINKQQNEQLTKVLGVDVYEFKGEPFKTLVSCLPNKPQEIYNRLRGCYSLISDKNLQVFISTDLIFGYPDFPIDHVMHVCEKDAYSMDMLDGTVTVNRLMHPEEILKSGKMNEIQILNDYLAPGKYQRISPSYLICFDEINEKSLKIAQEMHLPIVIIYRDYYLNQYAKMNSANLPIYKNEDYVEYSPKL